MVATQRKLFLVEHDLEFYAFHNRNPQVYRELVHLAKQLKRAGHKHYGIKALFEVLRFHRELETTRRDLWKLNNNFTSRYARVLMEQEPELRGFFSTREMKT